MSIKTKKKVCVEFMTFDNDINQYMRLPWNAFGIYDWYELSNDIGSWLLITSELHLAELEAHWYDSKGGY
tara:strand:+ start:1697 stop:1906 length:210 start_codon:yes stop_codon:yes gene_type:complete